jgi:Tfp pilus assembly protein PilX
MKQRREDRGFALVAALMANLILLAVGIIALNLSTGDLRISMRAVGDKKAVNAAEAGLHWLTVNFSPANIPTLKTTDNQVDAAADPNSRYRIDDIKDATTGPAQITLPGFSQVWGLARYDAQITGRNAVYNSSMTIDVGLGHGPVPLGTSYQ